MSIPKVVAASDGLVFYDDGSVYERCLPATNRGEWREREPLPRTDRALEVERERSGASGPPWSPRLKEAS